VVGTQQGELPVLFKHGPAFKLSMERENLERWASLKPGLTPEVKAFVPAREGQEAALILEFLPSRTLQAFFLENVEIEALKGLKLALETMTGLWRSTKEDKPARAEFTRQAESRLSEATTLFPQLMTYFGSIGALKIQPLEKLLSQAKRLEAGLYAPFTARIHGDFNLSNLLYNPSTGKIHFIDLYRSRESDYIQDVSVMLVSIVRLPVFEAERRGLLTLAVLEAAKLCDRFAKEMGDLTYEARLAFGLARSFVTSTRFIMKEKLAAMFVSRARYLWEKLLEHGKAGRDWASFAFSREILRVPTEEPARPKKPVSPAKTPAKKPVGKRPAKKGQAPPLSDQATPPEPAANEIVPKKESPIEAEALSEAEALREAEALSETEALSEAEIAAAALAVSPLETPKNE
jgi:hypothetical protein